MAPLGKGEVQDYNPGTITLRAGFLQFTKETAHNWAGPFEGGYAAFHLVDWTNATYQYSKFTPKKNGIKVLDYISKSNDPHPTFEFPIELKMYGNDDTSYAKYYKTQEEALAELQLFEDNQPLDFKIIKDFKFYFTN